MITTTDQATIHEDQPTTPTQAERPAGPVPAPSPTRQRRSALRWFGGAIVAVAAAALVSVLVIASDTDTSANQVVVTDGSDDIDATELDVHGIPTWWSGRAPRP
jgi:hypothetical protein